MSALGLPETATAPDNRSLLIGASCVAIATLVPVALYQVGVIRDLPDPPGDIFDSERITSSKIARPFGIPDALLGLASFGATLTLAILAGRSRTAKKLLGVKLTIDASAAIFNAGRQVVEFGKLCSWCTATAISAGVMTYAGRGSIREALTEGKGLAKAVLAQRRKND